MAGTSKNDGGAIAVVGMACRFPGDATDIESFWEMLRDGKDAWSEIPSDRFNAKGWYHPDPNRPGSFHIKGAHFIKGDIAAFDAPFFSISTAEVVSMDPQQRMLLEVVYEALDSAGVPVSTLSNSATSVFCGSFVRDYEQPCMRDPDTTPPYSATGNGIAILANRVSHAFDFAGTSQTIDTGCSASMIAVHQACKSLLTGESDMGIAAGVGLIFSPNTLVPMANLNILGADGRCYTFDQRASGYGRGEGIGVVVLKRLDDAIADNDTIRAVIRATASNQDGHTQGITLPSKERQIQNMTAIYRDAGLDATRTAYMECHGTGTQAGDVKELEAVTKALCSHRTADNPLVVSSVKTNIGHLEGSAGVAGLIKGILVVERGFIPKHLNYATPNPKIDLHDMKLKIPTALTPWPVSGLRRASVNSFGFGGTNAHVVLDDAPHFLAERSMSSGQHCSFLFPGDTLLAHQQHKASHPPQSHLFVFSGHDEAGLHRVVASQAAFLEKRNGTVPDADAVKFEANYAYTLFARRSRLNWRSFVVASSTTELRQKLQDQAIAQPVRASLRTPSRLALVFCGQGAQWYAMGRELLCYPVFHTSLSGASSYMDNVLGSPFCLWDELHRNQETSSIDTPQIAQPATTAIQVALVDLLFASGLEPSAVVGHSSGEIAAAYALGAICREDAWAIAYHRGRCVAHLANEKAQLRGGMLAVTLSADDAWREIVNAGVSSVDVACINGPNSVTLSGDTSGITRLCEHFHSQGTRATPIKVSTAYHSRYMRAIEADYRAALADIAPAIHSRRSGHFFSSVYGRKAELYELDAGYWVKNLVQPVQFYGAVSALLQDTQPGAFLEVSPHRVWESTLQQIATTIKLRQPTYASLLQRKQHACVSVLSALGALWAQGFTFGLDWALAMPEHKPRHLVDVPSYPWDHSRKYWHESHLSKANRFRSHGREDIIGAPLENSTPLDPRWRGFFRVQENPWLLDHVIQKSVIYPAGGMVAMAIEAAKQLADSHRDVLGFEVTDFVISKPMLIPSTPHGLEHLLSAHLVTSTISPGDRTQYSFSIQSKPEDGPWTAHAHGCFTIIYVSNGEAALAKLERLFCSNSRRQAYHSASQNCHTHFVPRQFYETLDVVGMTYGPQFRNLVDISKSDQAVCAVIRVPDTKSQMPFEFEFDHIIHPATLDTMLQTVLACGSDDDDAAMLPCSVARIFVSAQLPQGAGALFRGLTTARKLTPLTVSAEVTMFDDSLQAPAVIIENLGFKAAPTQAGTAAGGGFLPANRNLCSEIVWKQDLGSTALFDLDSLGIPSTAQELVDLAAHKNPALSVLFHMQGDATAAAGSSSMHILKDIAWGSMAVTTLVFDNLSAGYETPRFSECHLSGLYAENVWDDLHISKRSSPNFDRVHIHTQAAAASKKHFDLVLWSVDVQKPLRRDAVLDMARQVADNGWLVLLAKSGKALSDIQRLCFRSTVQEIGLLVGKDQGTDSSINCSTNSIGFIAAFKSQIPHSGVTVVKRDKVILLLPQEMSPCVRVLKDTLVSRLEAEFATPVTAIAFDDIATLTQKDLTCPVVSLAEFETPLLFSMGEDTFASLHRVLTHTKGLVWLTSGAQRNTSDPKLSPFVGLARTLRSEDPKKKIASLDLEDADSLDKRNVLDKFAASIAFILKRLFTASSSPQAITAMDDFEFVFSSDHLHIPRLMPLTALNHVIEKGPSTAQMVVQTPLLTKGKALRLDVSSINVHSAPRFVEDHESLHRALLPNEVRISVIATNLLPDDMARLRSTTAQTAAVGTDVFGQVVAVGADVTHLWPQCRVVARLRGTIQTHVVVDQSRVRSVKIEEHWTSSCPTAFATALYALRSDRRINKGDAVLVYAPASAYGQMVIRLAIALGGRVLAACTTAKEKQLMHTFMVPPSHVLDLHEGKDNRLEAQVRALTQNHGVHIVFDPTSQHLEQAFCCVAECGRVIRVAWDGCDVSNLLLPAKNLSFETVDLALLEARQPHEAEKLAFDVDRILQLAPNLADLYGTVECKMSDLDGALRSATANVFNAPHVLFTEAKGPNEVDLSVPFTEPVHVEPLGTYVLVGGLGGVGRSIAEHLVKIGAKHLAFFSRSGASSARRDAQMLLANLQSAGVDARCFAVDVCNEEQLAVTLAQVHDVMPPIKGAIQCAAVVDDISFPSMDYARWRRAFAPKVLGSWNLHRQLPEDMDFLIFLSSSSGIIGNRGQANYAAGNGFQDALARHRTHVLRRPSVSLDLGLVLGAGMVAENEDLLDAMQASGFIGMRLQDALYLLERAMTAPQPNGAFGQTLRLPAQVVTTVGTGGLTLQNQPADPFWTRTALFRYLNQVDAPPQGLSEGGDGQSGGADDLRTKLQMAGSLEGATKVVSMALIGAVARRKGMVPEDFDTEQSLSCYGIDSLDAIFVLGWLARETGVTAQTVEGVTIVELSQDVARRALAALEQEDV